MKKRHAQSDVTISVRAATADVWSDERKDPSAGTEFTDRERLSTVGDIQTKMGND